MEPAIAILVLLVFAFLVESMVEFLIGQLPVNLGQYRTPIISYVALAFGVALAVLYQLDALKLLLGPQLNAPPIVGQVLTGLIIGRGGNYVHDFYKRITDGPAMYEAGILSEIEPKTGGALPER